jgi:hypothetical protein
VISAEFECYIEISAEFECCIVICAEFERIPVSLIAEFEW